jgi:quercetin dioxygenase-like cupin family protein
MPRKQAEKLVPVGKRIKKARLEKKVTLPCLANETGCAVDYLKKLEAGREMPPVGTLLQIARCLGLDSIDLLKEQAAKASDRVKAYSKRTDDYAYTTLTPGAENKHLKAFRVVVEPMQEHHGVGYQHEGEEYVYVLKGRLDILVGENLNQLTAGQSLLFNSGIKHKMINSGRAKVEFISVIYVP